MSRVSAIAARCTDSFHHNPSLTPTWLKQKNEPERRSLYRGEPVARPYARFPR